MDKETQNENENTESQIQTNEAPQEAQIKYDYTKAASKHGHISLDDWVKQGRDPDDWTSPEDFIRNHTWVKEIKKRDQKLDEMSRALEGLVEHNKKVEKISYEKAYADLNRKLEEAASVGDTAQVKAINKEIVDLSTKDFQTQQKPTPGLTDAERDFMARNSSWFNDNSPNNTAMRAYAMHRANQIALENPGIDQRMGLQMIENDVKTNFSNYFDKTNSTMKVQEKVTHTPQVEPPVLQTQRRKEFSISDLPAKDRSLAELLKKTTRSFDEKHYLKQYKTINGVEE